MKRLFSKKISFLLLCCSILILLGNNSTWAQSSNSTFGQNRVQYHGFDWSFYETEHFNIYYYIGGQDLGKFVILDAEKEFKDVSQLLDLHQKTKVDIMVYNDITDANMTNIGIHQDIKNVGGRVQIIDNKMFIYFDGNHNHLREQIRQGLTRIYIEKMSQGGNFQQLLQNAVIPNLPTWYTEGLTQFIAKGWTPEDDDKLRMGIKSKRYRKFKRLTVEDANFIGKSFWNYVMIEYGQDAMSNLLYITRINPKNLDNAFNYALNKGINEALNESFKFYIARYTQLEKNSTPLDKANLLPITTKEKTDYFSLLLNDKADKIAYASNQYGRQKLYVYDLQKKKKKVILRNGFRTNTLLTDNSYPLFAWEPGGNKLAVMYEKRDQIKLMLYDVLKHNKSVKRVTKFQKVYSMSYGSDRGTLLLSASQKGQCDIFSYQINNTTTTQITNDFWDDLNPQFIRTDEYRGIVFLSNRRSDTIRNEKLDKDLPLGGFNLYFYSPIESSSYYAKITDNDIRTTTRCVQDLNSQYFSYLSNESGVSNRYIAKLERSFWYMATTYYIEDSLNESADSVTLHADTPIDSFFTDMTGITIDSTKTFPVYKLRGYPFVVSNENSSIIEQSLSLDKLKAAELHYTGKKYEIYLRDLDTNVSSLNQLNLVKYGYDSKPADTIVKDVNIVIEQEFENADSAIWIQLPKDTVQRLLTPFFQTEFDVYDDSLHPHDSQYISNLSYSTISAAPQTATGYKFSKNRPYLVKMMVDRVAAQLDNNLLITRYAPFNPGNPSYLPQVIGGLINMGVVDLMEDYRITGGFRIPLISAPTSEYYLSYENLKKRLDKKYTYYRSVFSQNQKDLLTVPFDTVILKPENLPLRYDIKTNYGEILLKYPFDVLQGLRFGFALRNDRYMYRATNEQTILLQNYSTNWVSFKVEYVFDNTFDLGTNLRSGTRLRLFSEAHKEIPTKDTRITNGFIAKLPSWNNAYFGIVGADIRHYEKLYRNIILATRLSWNTSFGNHKMIYYLGGVEGGVSPKFNKTTPINSNNNYAFQSLATDMRGFDQNIRNGNSVILINAEVRIPLLSTFSNTPIRSQFLKNFQLVGFCDVGTAWEGKSPFNKANPLYQNVIRDPLNSPVIVTVYQYRNPIVVGFGPGLRTSIFGYFIRADLAWGYDGNKIISPKLHFSFNLDF